MSGLCVSVVGCGAIGSLYAAHLTALPDVDVWVYDPNAQLIDAVKSHGLAVSGLADLRATVNATSDPAQLPPSDFGLIACKVQHTRAAISSTAHAFEHGAVCSLQNGIASDEVLYEYNPSVISSSIYLGGRLVLPGTVELDTTGIGWIGCYRPFPDGADRLTRLSTLLTAAGLETRCHDNILGVKWSKLIFNCAANPVCALTGLTFGRVFGDSALRELVLALAREGIEVAAGSGITLSEDPVTLLEKAHREAFNHIPSMLNDVLHKRPTEIDALNGSLAQAGNSAGLSCTMNAHITALIKGLEASWA
ncbi:MAG: ketopantoate reductase family protein [Parahaliea sp.]